MPHTDSAVERVFREYSNRATGADFRAAAAEMLAWRKAEVARAAATLREARASLAEQSRGVRSEIRAMCSRWIREHHGRLGRQSRIPRATAEGMRLELAGLRRSIAWAQSPEAHRRAQSLPCGLQDAAASNLFADQQLARLLKIMIRMEGRGGPAPSQS